MAKRRKRRRIAFINRMNEIIKENPNMGLEQVKTRTAIEVKNALRVADRSAPHDREEHSRIFEDTLFSRNKTTATTKPKAATNDPTTTTKTATAKTKAAPKPKTATRAKKTTAKNTTTTTKKRTTTKRTKKAK